MSVAVGIRTKGGCVLASDTEGTQMDKEERDARYSYKRARYAKIVSCGDSVALAASGRYRTCQVAQLVWLPWLHKQWSTGREITTDWLATKGIAALRKAFVADGDVIERADGTEFVLIHGLLAVDGRLWRIDGDLCIHPIEDPPYDSIGGGTMYAAGAMHALWGKQDAEAVATAAIQAATAFHPYCGGDPHLVVTTSRKEEEKPDPPVPPIHHASKKAMSDSLFYGAKKEEK